MAANIFGNILQFTSFGESHGPAIGGVLDGLPPGLIIDYEFIKDQLKRRKPVFKQGGTSRREDDEIIWLSGIVEGKTTGAPLVFMMENKNYQSKDYDELKNVYRPSHADYTYEKKYGIRDYRGGGRSSARETATRVVAGSIAQSVLKTYGIEILSAVTQIGEVKASKSLAGITKDKVHHLKYGFLDDNQIDRIDLLIEGLRQDNDTTGGVISCVIRNVPVGIGEPVYHKLHAELASAMMSINAVKGFEYGEGFKSAEKKGSEHNDSFILKDERVHTKTNFSGGIQGGISNGEDILFRVAFKPVSSIGKKQKTIDSKGQSREIEIVGRHDVCVVPRALPVVESMAALVIADHLLWANASKIS